MRNYLQPSLGLPCAVDTESTLSNVTSIQSQLQSLYETCHDPLKFYQQQQQQPQPTNYSSSDKTNLQKALDKHTHLLQELKFKNFTSQQQQQQQSYNPATYVLSPAKSNAGAGGANNTVGGGTAAASQGGVSGKTATILVSKSKTKTGLPLLLKNSINN